jgi:hypothetical protein
MASDLRADVGVGPCGLEFIGGFAAGIRESRSLLPISYSLTSYSFKSENFSFFRKGMEICAERWYNVAGRTERERSSLPDSDAKKVNTDDEKNAEPRGYAHYGGQGQTQPAPP